MEKYYLKHRTENLKAYKSFVKEITMTANHL